MSSESGERASFQDLVGLTARGRRALTGSRT
jgi:hypothetical protein